MTNIEQDAAAGPESLEELLVEDRANIVGEAAARVARLDGYRRDGAAEARRRIAALHHELVQAVRSRDLAELRRHAARVARERRAAGFAHGEVEAAFAALEAAIRLDAVARLPAYDQAFALGLVHTALRHAQEALGAVFGAAAPARDGEADLTPLFDRDAA